MADKPKVNRMVTRDGDPEIFAALDELESMRAEIDKRSDEIRDRARADMEALKLGSMARHKAAWDAIKRVVGVGEDEHLSLIDNFVKDHGVAFIRSTDDEDDNDDADEEAPQGLGELIARALGGAGKVNIAVGPDPRV